MWEGSGGCNNEKGLESLINRSRERPPFSSLRHHLVVGGPVPPLSPLGRRGEREREGDGGREGGRGRVSERARSALLGVNPFLPTHPPAHCYCCARGVSLLSRLVSS
eukprot:scaffold303399_cov22-Tisochrysis_lutea.AAC.1